MAKTRTCHNPAPTGKNKLAKNTVRAPTKNNSTFTSILAVFRALTPVLAQDPVLAKVFISGSLDIYTDENLQKTTRLALELFMKGQKYS